MLAARMRRGKRKRTREADARALNRESLPEHFFVNIFSPTLWDIYE
jgi:hypothetical protein